MKHLKTFLESKLQSEDDITDYLLELVDDGFLEFKKIDIENKKIEFVYSILTDFSSISNLKDLKSFEEKILTLYNILGRWNLEFRIKSKGYHSSELSIYSDAPEYISDCLRDVEMYHLDYDKTGTYFGKGNDIYLGGFINKYQEVFLSIRTENKKDSKIKIQSYIDIKNKNSKKYQLKFVKNIPTGEYIYQIIPKIILSE
jgi:hypothetical protein